LVWFAWDDGMKYCREDEEVNGEVGQY